jgi:AcrR family transcriptional regulator
VQPIDAQAVRDIFARLEFRTLLPRVFEALGGDADEASAGSAPAVAAPVPAELAPAAVAEWIEAHLMARLGEARQAAPDALQGLEAMFLAHVQFIRELPGVPRFVFAELQQPGDSPVRQCVQKIMQRHRQTVAEALESAKAVQLIRLDLDCHAAAALFLGAIQGLVIQTMLGEVPAEIDERARGVLRLYLCGLGARP